jgi:hypothetical protein
LSTLFIFSPKELLGYWDWNNVSLRYKTDDILQDSLLCQSKCIENAKQTNNFHQYPNILENWDLKSIIRQKSREMTSDIMMVLYRFPLMRGGLGALEAPIASTELEFDYKLSNK